MRLDAIVDDAEVAATPDDSYIPPQAFLRDRHDAASYKRPTLLLVLTLYAVLGIAMTS